MNSIGNLLEESVSERLLLDPRKVKLTTRSEVAVHRLLPHAHLRRIGAWVFVDHFGPTDHVEGMTVAQHPHTGLQTVTWLLSGKIDHRDSLGTSQLIEPGQLNLMTAGNGVAHSERSLPTDQPLHAVQLWLALPESVRDSAPAFQHLSSFQNVTHHHMRAKVFIGELLGQQSAAVVHSPLVGAEIELDGRVALPLNPNWEHGILLVSGSLSADSQSLQPTQLIYLQKGVSEVKLEGISARAIFIGGEPFVEPLVMWWNFIGRSHDEIVAMRERWNARDYPGFADDVGGWLPAPELPSVTLKAR